MKFLHDRKQLVLALSFLLAELVLYYFVLTAGGTLLVYSSYIAIVLCFAYALACPPKGSRLIIGGLACTVMADFFLVVCSPRQQLWGMVFFLIAQTLYAVRLHTATKSRLLLLIRVSLIVAIEVIAIIVLGDKLDALAVVSVCYYANLVVNILEAFARFSQNKLLPIGLVLFLLCDTVIGLQVASGGYLPIQQGSWLYQFLFMDFNLSWLFYLPSQVLISLSSKTMTD